MIILFFLMLSVSLAVGEMQTDGGCGFCCDKVLAKLESLEQSLNTLMTANGLQNTNHPVLRDAKDFLKGTHDQSQSLGAAINVSQGQLVNKTYQPSDSVGLEPTAPPLGEVDQSGQPKFSPGPVATMPWSGAVSQPIPRTDVKNKPQDRTQFQHTIIMPPSGRVNHFTSEANGTKKMLAPAANEKQRYPLGIEPTEEQLTKHTIYNSCHNVPTRGKYLIRNTDGIGLLNMVCDSVPLSYGQYEKGWIVVQNRFNGCESFYRSWDDYVAGFGNLDGEFWLGLDLIRKLVNNGFEWELMFRLTSFQGETKYQRYSNLTIGDATDEYMLKQASNAGGDAGDSFSRHQRSMFTTYDRDNDRSLFNCAKKHEGGWWYHNQCTSSNLNGYYTNSKADYANFWQTMRPAGFGLKATKMMIRFIPEY